MYDIVIVMSQCYLVASEFLGEVEHFLASVPRAQEAFGLFFFFGGVEASSYKVWGCTKIGA